MGDNTDKKLYELPENCDFMDVANNEVMKFDCTPRLIDRFTSTFRGLIINAPREVVWPKETVENAVYYPSGHNTSPYRLMVAGLSKLPDSTLNYHKDIVYQIVVVAVNNKTAKSYSGKMTGFGTPSPSLQPIGGGGSNKPVEEPDYVRQSYFNIDLVQNLGIPIDDASYSVYATIENYKSNVLQIKTTIK